MQQVSLKIKKTASSKKEKEKKYQAHIGAEADGLHADRSQVQSTFVNLTLPFNAIRFIGPIRVSSFPF